MAQLGCFRASATLTSLSLSTGQSRNAPPDAVKMILFKAPGGNPCRHWKMAMKITNAFLDLNTIHHTCIHTTVFGIGGQHLHIVLRKQRHHYRPARY